MSSHHHKPLTEEQTKRKIYKIRRAKRARKRAKWFAIRLGLVVLLALILLIYGLVLDVIPIRASTSLPTVCRYAPNQKWRCGPYALGPLNARFTFGQPMSVQANLRLCAHGKLPVKAESLMAKATLQHMDARTDQWVNVSTQNASDKHVADSRRVAWTHVFGWKHLKLSALYRVKLTLTLVLSNSKTAAAFAYRLPVKSPVILTE